VKNKIDKIEKPANIDYKESAFTTKYPKILLPQSIIEERQRKNYDDAKNSFIQTFKTSGDGEGE